MGTPWVRLWSVIDLCVTLPQKRNECFFRIGSDDYANRF